MVSKAEYAAWEADVVKAFYSNDKSPTELMPVNGAPAKLSKEKIILVADASSTQYTSVSAQVASRAKHGLPPHQHVKLFHAGLQKEDNVRFGLADDNVFKHPACDAGGLTNLRQQLGTSVAWIGKPTEWGGSTTKTGVDKVAKALGAQWRALSKTEITPRLEKDLEKFLLSLEKAMRRVTIRFYKLPAEHRVVVTAADVKAATGRYFVRTFGAEYHAKSSDGKGLYCGITKAFVTPNLSEANLRSEYVPYTDSARAPSEIVYQDCRRGAGCWLFLAVAACVGALAVAGWWTEDPAAAPDWFDAAWFNATVAPLLPLPIFVCGVLLVGIWCVGLDECLKQLRCCSSGAFTIVCALALFLMVALEVGVPQQQAATPLLNEAGQLTPLAYLLTTALIVLAPLAPRAVVLPVIASCAALYVWLLPAAARNGFAPPLDLLWARDDADAAGFLLTPQSMGGFVAAFWLPLTVINGMAGVGGVGDSLSELKSLRATAVVTTSLFFLWLLVASVLRAPTRYQFICEMADDEVCSGRDADAAWLTARGIDGVDGMTYTLQPPVAMFDDFGDKWYQETASGMARRWADTAVFVGVAVALRAHVRAAAAAGRLGATAAAWCSCTLNIACVALLALVACSLALANVGGVSSYGLAFHLSIGVWGAQAIVLTVLALLPALLQPAAPTGNLPLNSTPAWRGLWSVAAPAACVFGLPFWFKLFDNRIDLYSLDLPATAYSTPCGGNEDASVSMYIDSPFSTALFGFAFFFPFLDQWTWGGVANKGGAAASEISILGRRVSAEAATCRALLLSLQISLLLFLVVPVSYDLGAHMFFFLVILVYAFALFLGLLFFNFGLNDCVLNTVLVLNMASITLAIGLAQAIPGLHGLAAFGVRPYVSCESAQLWLFECIAFSMMPLFIEVQIFKAKAKAARDRAAAAKALV